MQRPRNALSLYPIPIPKRIGTIIKFLKTYHSDFSASKESPIQPSGSRRLNWHQNPQDGLLPETPPAFRETHSKHLSQFLRTTIPHLLPGNQPFFDCPSRLLRGRLTSVPIHTTKFADTKAHTIRPNPNTPCMIKIYLYEHLEDLDQSFVNDCLTLMPPQQKEKILNIHHLKGKIESCIGYFLLIQALRDNHYPIETLPEYQYNQHGKPHLAEFPQLHFSISHCKKAVIVAISNNPIGIDIELPRKINTSLLSRVCSPEEKKLIMQSTNPEKTFIALWTKKEAYSKMLGIGISHIELSSGIYESEFESFEVLNGEGIATISYIP